MAACQIYGRPQRVESVSSENREADARANRSRVTGNRRIADRDGQAAEGSLGRTVAEGSGMPAAHYLSQFSQPFPQSLARYISASLGPK